MVVVPHIRYACVAVIQILRSTHCEQPMYNLGIGCSMPLTAHSAHHNLLCVLRDRPTRLWIGRDNLLMDRGKVEPLVPSGVHLSTGLSPFRANIGFADNSFSIPCLL